MIEYSAFTTSPDEQRAIDSLNAISTYITSQRSKSTQFPAILPLIKSFEGWYGLLEEKRATASFIELPIITVTEVNEAKRRRYEIDVLTGNTTPEDRIPGDSPQTPPDAPPSELSITELVAGAVVLGFFGYLIINRVTR